MSSQIKQIRGQLRQIVKEMLPELIQVEFYKELHTANTARLEQIGKNVDDLIKNINTRIEKSLEEMNARSKDVQDFVIRQAATPALSLQPEVKKD